MKSIKFISLLIIVVSMVGCQDFLDRTPTTSITPKNFFKSVSDLHTYTNGLYDQLRYSFNDVPSDNISHHSESDIMNRLLHGTLTPATVGGWNWSNLRQINYFLDHYQTAKGDKSSINHYVGIARFFRAWFYFEKIKKYGSVPWYSHALNTNDTDALYAGKDSRTLIADSIVADLKFAVKHIPANVTSKTEISKFAALQLLARFALYEGTFRKYHKRLGLANTAKRYLKLAVNASEQIMTSGKYHIYTAHGVNSYGDLFHSTNLANNPEIILYTDYSDKLSRYNNTETVFDYTYAFSQSLASSYLMKDGTPFDEKEGYKQTTFVNMFKNRDPRMRQTIMPPGFIEPGNSDPYRLEPGLGGYLQIKFLPQTADQIAWFKGYTDIPIFRYAETLLIYAEAKAELGKLTQSDLNKSINLLRRRVNMPDMILTEVESNIDPILEKRYPNVSGPEKGAILAIRRERRVELAGEGFRNEDIQRWAVGQLFAKPGKGIYVKNLGPMDVTGDGKPDIAILESPDKRKPLNGLSQEELKNISIYYLKDKSGKRNSFYLEYGDHGHIMFTQERRNPPKFIAPKDYYIPIPQQQMVLNDNLTQPPGW